MLLTLGNQVPIETPDGVVHGAITDYTRLDPTVCHTTTIIIPDSAVTDPKALAEHAVQAWGAHSLDAPGWIQGDSLMTPDVEEILRDALGMPHALDDDVIRMLLTNAGHDFCAKQLAGSASATAVAKWIALSANTDDPSASDTTLTGEITTASGGLVRAEGSYAHTGSTNTYTVSKTFTTNGNDSLPVTIAKLGNFDADSSGNMVFETKLGTTATLSASGDTLAITWTITV
jgi:hypothetical protein